MYYLVMKDFFVILLQKCGMDIFVVDLMEYQVRVLFNEIGKSEWYMLSVVYFIDLYVVILGKIGLVSELVQNLMECFNVFVQCVCRFGFDKMLDGIILLNLCMELMFISNVVMVMFNFDMVCIENLKGVDNVVVVLQDSNCILVLVGVCNVYGVVDIDGIVGVVVFGYDMQVLGKQVVYVVLYEVVFIFDVVFQVCGVVVNDYSIVLFDVVLGELVCIIV